MKHAREWGREVPRGACRRRAGVEPVGAGPVARVGAGEPELRMKSEFLGKSGGLLRPGVSVSQWYEFIDAQKALFPIVLMCLWVGVSRSGFYDWLSRPASATAGLLRRRVPRLPRDRQARRTRHPPA